VTSPDRMSLGFIAAAVLCCAAPVLVGTGLAAAALGPVRQHWDWFAAGVGLFAAVVFLGVRRGGQA
jgi:hypothetical protein